MNREFFEKLTKQQLIDLLELDSKNWVACDGVWFQSVERKFGMDEAIFHDEEAWKRFTVIEAKRIKEFLQLPKYAGLDGLAAALPYRINNRCNKCEIIREENRLVYKVVDCRVQTARKRKGMPLHPCKSVAEYEYSGFASIIDSRISCKCLSCYPDIADEGCACGWEFTLKDE